MNVITIVGSMVKRRLIVKRKVEHLGFYTSQSVFGIINDAGALWPQLIYG